MRKLVQNSGLIRPLIRKTHTRSKEAKSQNKNGPNGPQVLIFINKHSTGRFKRKPPKMLQNTWSIKWIDIRKTTKYEWYPNTTFANSCYQVPEVFNLASGTNEKIQQKWGKKKSTGKIRGETSSWANGEFSPWKTVRTGPQLLSDLKLTWWGHLGTLDLAAQINAVIFKTMIHMIISGSVGPARVPSYEALQIMDNKHVAVVGAVRTSSSGQ